MPSPASITQAAIDAKRRSVVTDLLSITRSDRSDLETLVLHQLEDWCLDEPNLTFHDLTKNEINRQPIAEIAAENYENIYSLKDVPRHQLEAVSLLLTWGMLHHVKITVVGELATKYVPDPSEILPYRKIIAKQLVVEFIKHAPGATKPFHIRDWVYSTYYFALGLTVCAARSHQRVRLEVQAGQGDEDLSVSCSRTLTGMLSSLRAISNAFVPILQQNDCDDYFIFEPDLIIDPFLWLKTSWSKLDEEDLVRKLKEIDRCVRMNQTLHPWIELGDLPSACTTKLATRIINNDLHAWHHGRPLRTNADGTTS